MDMYLEAKSLSLHQKMAVRDKHGELLYEVHSKPVSMGSKMHVSDPLGNDLLFVHENIPVLGSKFWIEQDGNRVAEIKRKMGIRNDYEVDGLEWTAEGDIANHEFTIRDSGGEIICTVKQDPQSQGEWYHAWIEDDLDPVISIGVIVSLERTDEARKDEEAVAYGVETGTVFGSDA